jgi:hypothetical protein
LFNFDNKNAIPRARARVVVARRIEAARSLNGAAWYGEEMDSVLLVA